MPKPDVKILVCYHKPDYLFKDDILTPIHVGRSLAKERMSPDDERLKWLMSNLIGDDTGDNISKKNASYNELTAVYWAWKNYEELGNPDYIGLMHYRRHFIYRDLGDIAEITVKQVDENYHSLTDYSFGTLEQLLSETDIVFHEGKVSSIQEHYAENHDINDLHSVISILDELHPLYSRTAHSYLTQDKGSFCNMFIFSRDLFLEYCEWLFSILDAYEASHDLTEKRLFVSERLTGIFIQKKIDDGFTNRKLPIALLTEPVTIPVAIPYQKDLFSISVTMMSHVFSAESTTTYKFYLLGIFDNRERNALITLSKDFKFELELINPHDCITEYGLSPDYIHSGMLVLHLLLPNVNKCVYLSDKILSTRDESEFYRTSNVDDFWVNGIPEFDDNPALDDKEIVLDLLVLNLKRFRDHELHKKYKQITEEGPSDPKDILHKVCSGHIGYNPRWFYKKAITKNRTDLFDSKKKRGNLQYESRWTPYIYFNEYSPVHSMQGIYSVLWWNVASKIPGYAGPPIFDINNTWDTMINQQQRLGRFITDESHSSKSQSHSKVKGWATTNIEKIKELG